MIGTGGAIAQRPRDPALPSPGLLTRSEREALRRAKALPILKAQHTFLARLRDEGVVVIKAETGSGKTTQLPQYCAEVRPGSM